MQENSVQLKTTSPTRAGAAPPAAPIANNNPFGPAAPDLFGGAGAAGSPQQRPSDDLLSLSGPNPFLEMSTVPPMNQTASNPFGGGMGSTTSWPGAAPAGRWRYRGGGMVLQGSVVAHW